MDTPEEEPEKSLRDCVRDAVATYGPTAVQLIQLGLAWWYALRHGSAGL
jgi:hypothetical protein